MSRDADILIIGGGMAGASAGFFMADGAKVVLLERETQPGYHTTGRSAALYTEGYGNAPIRAITKATRPFLDAPPPGFTDTPLLSPRGALLVATADQLDLLEAGRREIAALIDELHVLEGDDLFALAPFLARDVVVRGVYEPAAMDMDVNAILWGFLRGLKAKGGEVVTGAEVTGLARDGAGWRVDTSAGTFGAAVVVNAAGAWADVVGAMAGAKPIGLVPKRRTAFTFDLAAGVDPSPWPATIGCDESWYIRPDAGRIFGSPADETPSEPCDAQPEELDLAIAVDRIETHTDFRIRRFASRWAGLRSFVEDKTPVVGFEHGLPGFFWLAGQGGYGIQTSAGMGRISAALAGGGAMPDDVAALGVTAATLAPGRPGLVA